METTVEDDGQEKGEKEWFPLESNPDLLNFYSRRLGFDSSIQVSHRTKSLVTWEPINTTNRTNRTEQEFVDVFSTESWALEMISQPVSAVMVLFPTQRDKVKQRRREMHEEVKANSETSPNLWYAKQRIRNACGTIAVLHALANCPKQVRDVSIQPSTWLSSFLDKCPASIPPGEKAEILEGDVELERMHEHATGALCNATSRGALGDKVDMHFITFVCVDGKLYELDGRVDEGPICYGETAQDRLLRDTCEIIKRFMEADPSEMRFTLVALAPKTLE